MGVKVLEEKERGILSEDEFLSRSFSLPLSLSLSLSISLYFSVSVCLSLIFDSLFDRVSSFPPLPFASLTLRITDCEWFRVTDNRKNCVPANIFMMRLMPFLISLMMLLGIFIPALSIWLAFPLRALLNPFFSNQKNAITHKNYDKLFVCGNNCVSNKEFLRWTENYKSLQQRNPKVQIMVRRKKTKRFNAQ